MRPLFRNFDFEFSRFAARGNSECGVGTIVLQTARIILLRKTWCDDEGVLTAERFYSAQEEDSGKPPLNGATD
jgi:hypothetical protein